MLNKCNLCLTVLGTEKKQWSKYLYLFPLSYGEIKWSNFCLYVMQANVEQVQSMWPFLSPKVLISDMTNNTPISYYNSNCKPDLSIIFMNNM